MKLLLEISEGNDEYWSETYYAFEAESKELAEAELYILAEEAREKHDSVISFDFHGHKFCPYTFFTYSCEYDRVSKKYVVKGLSYTNPHILTLEEFYQYKLP